MLLVLNAACATPHPPSRNPDNAGWAQARTAAGTALRDPHTWVPAAVAALLVVTDTDKALSRWAAEHRPVYGSQRSAQDAGDRLRTALAGSAVVTSLVAPGQQDAWLPGRPGSLVTLALAATATSQITGDLKDATDRERPNGVDRRSFPSSHSAAASTYATVAAQRTRELSLSPGQSQAFQAGFHTLAAATAWARVEARAHYPVDVLTGYALGNLTAVLAHETLQRSGHPLWFGIERDRHHDTFLLNIGISF